MSGTSSSAATKCISEVPGIGEADVDAGADQGGEEGAGSVHDVVSCLRHAEQPVRAEDPVRVEDPLDRAHQLERRRVLDLEEVRLLLRPDAVLAGDGAPGGDGARKISACISACRRSSSGWKTERWTLPSPT